MKTQKIISAVWNNREQTKLVAYVEEQNSDNDIITKYYYGLDRDDLAPLNKLLWKQIDNGQIKVDDNITFLRLDGKVPLHPGTAIVNGEIVDIEIEKSRQRQRIRGRINELYSGYEIALSERNKTYAANRKRKIDNLLAMEKDPDIYADILEEEDK